MIPDSFYLPETRCGYAVSAKAKKIWSVELELLQLFDRFCKAYDLRYFAAYGTLLGAVRHQGFIPWDDDVDLMMLRPDYERMKQLAPSYFLPPYSFQASSVSDSLQLITPFAKLRDDRTSAVEFPQAPLEMSQGIFIDIFPMDSVDDGSREGAAVWRTKLELYAALSDPENYLRMAAAGRMMMDADTAAQLVELSQAERMLLFEDYCNNTFDATALVDFVGSFKLKKKLGYPLEAFSDIVLLPFEHISVPAPAGYEPILANEYGDYSKFVMGTSAHEGLFMDPDRSYRDYLR